MYVSRSSAKQYLLIAATSFLLFDGHLCGYLCWSADLRISSALLLDMASARPRAPQIQAESSCTPSFFLLPVLTKLCHVRADISISWCGLDALCAVVKMPGL
ncbi:hypothetical protein F5B22DRAFT_260627 [Xylaria bambusicola]|uniref:uncharacterized protein n=1 Tax=Xylaria bambusicola TaxID=326684 RepID=UPI0020084177|nr:uncharacterized protein F5B22DRAFT_260627 [Xylaria bambusicola]KAI0525927.1 hypothetical protein F5B22DRAFT_260627 [Xylaria bambusicola]